MVRASPCALTARASDEPISPKPTIAIRSKTGSPHQLRGSFWNRKASIAATSCFQLVLGADGDAQAIRQAVAAIWRISTPRDFTNSRTASASCGARTTPAGSWRRWDARVKPSLVSRSASQGRQRSLCALDRLKCSASARAAIPASIAGALTIERLAHAVQHIGDRRRAIGPAEPRAAQRVDFRECVRARRYWAGHEPIHAPRHSRAGRHIPHRPRPAPAAPFREYRPAAAEPRPWEYRIRSGCWGWPGRSSACAA